MKYLSVTVFEGFSAEIVRDFYMDNDYRKLWDKTVVEHEQLQVDSNTGIEIGRNIKKFPLLTSREYVLAWRLWQGKEKKFYCFTKVKFNQKTSLSLYLSQFVVASLLIILLFGYY